MITFWTLLFWTATGALVYVLGGYAAMVLALGGMRRHKRPRAYEPTVSLIIPAHNEAKILKAKLENSLALDYPREKLEIVVASDGSSDATVPIARAFEARGVAVLDFERRRGKASVLNDAVAHATGEVLCLCDANVMFAPDALRRLVDRLGDGHVGAATGQVRIASDESNFGHGESAYYNLERRLQSAESQLGSLMGVDGGMYVVRRELYRPLPADTILDDFVISMQVIRQGYRVVYEPRAIAHENGTPAASQEWRRRVRVSAGAAQSLVRGHYPPWGRPVELWQFVSHKLLRWLSPMFLLVLLVASVMLFGTSSFYRLALLGQAALYLAATIATVSVWFRQTRPGGIAFYFVMSNLALAVGLVKGLLSLQPVTWAQAERTGTPVEQNNIEQNNIATVSATNEERGASVKKIAVFGIGYVGCVTAACLSRDGHHVIGVDVDRDKVEALNAGRPPVAELGLDELLAEQVAAGSLRATSDVLEAVAETEIALIAVGTPSTRRGDVSTYAVERVVQSIGEALRDSDRPYTVVIRSTLMPGILEEQLAPRLSEAADRPLGPTLQICNNPEFLRESTAIRDYDDPPFVVFGTIDGWDAAPLFALYPNVQAEQIVTDSRTAAMLKYTCNAFHALKVAFANEIGSLAKSLGADGHRVMGLACQDTKLNISRAYLKPGFAFGGSCLPKDVRAVTRHAEREALRLNLLGSILPSNREHLFRAVDMIEETGVRKIGIVGLSFKAGTDDLRESPFVTLVETLVGRGFDVKIYDPGISISRLKGRNLAYIDQHLPHLAALLVEDPAELYDHAGLMVASTAIADQIDLANTFGGPIIDLRSSLVTAHVSGAEAASSSTSG